MWQESLADAIRADAETIAAHADSDLLESAEQAHRDGLRARLTVAMTAALAQIGDQSRTVRAALARWADDLGRPPTAEETALPGTRVPCRAIRREFGSFSSALEGRRPARQEPGHRAGKNGLPGRAGRPWADGWLHERVHTRDRRRKPNYRLPALEVKLGYRPLTACQQRELRAQWLAARVILEDFAERRCCSREIVTTCTSTSTS